MRPVVSLVVVLIAVLTASSGAPAPAEARDGTAGMSRAERAIVGAINAQRRAHGERRLRRSRALGRAASSHSGDMLRGDFFGHDSDDGTAFDARVRRFTRFGTLGETLAQVPGCDARDVVRLWMESPPHRAVLLNPVFRYVGVGTRSGSLGGGHTCVVTADLGA